MRSPNGTLLYLSNVYESSTRVMLFGRTLVTRVARDFLGGLLTSFEG